MKIIINDKYRKQIIADCIEYTTHRSEATSFGCISKISATLTTRLRIFTITYRDNCLLLIFLLFFSQLVMSLRTLFHSDNTILECSIHSRNFSFVFFDTVCDDGAVVSTWLLYKCKLFWMISARPGNTIIYIFITLSRQVLDQPVNSHFVQLVSKRCIIWLRAAFSIYMLIY